MNRLHVERKSKDEETKHEGENSLTESERSPEKNLNIALDNCLPVVSCHHGMFPELTSRSVEELPPPRIDKYKLARFLADKAIRERRIFTICGPYPVIRSCLRKRGWVERKHILKFDIQDHKDEGNEAERDNGVKNESKAVLHEEESLNNSNDIHDIMSRLVRNEETSFYWTTKKDAVDYYTLHIDQMLNHYSRTGSFTTKIGLCLHLRNLPWYVSVNPNSFFPRCYAICINEEKSAFIDDFRKTAAFCVIKWIVNLHISDDWSSKENSDKEDAIEIKDYEVKKVKELPGELVEMACKVCETYLEQFEHGDIDAETDNVPVLSETEWNKFIDHYYSLIHEEAVICNADSYFIQCQNILHKIRLLNPQQEIDGLHNIWIIKPGAKSRGREIVCKNRLDEILKLVEPTDQFPIKDHKWVVQKYIEKPLLIYDTKFDIRQWFLITDWNPLTIWFYKESYLRFSTQRFSLENLHSSVHLCNNFIQKNYKNASDRSSQLPYHNMWSSSKFQEYLQKRGLGHVWCNIIYPSMKKILIYIMKMAQEQVEARRSSFELYGADFILGSDFKPWLIEINSSPTMHPSTPITMDLCAKVQEDTIKVVLDKKFEKNCETGNFELLWRQPMLDMPPFNSTDLIVEGIGLKKLKKHVVISNFNFADPLLNILQPATNHESKGDSIPPINEKQNIKVTLGNNTPCTFPKTLEKKSEKSTKVKSTPKKPIKIIDFPRITILQEAAVIPDSKKTKAIKEPKQQTGNQAATSFPNSNSLDWALLQPSKDTGLQNQTKKTPCLVCGDGFQSEKTCKHCSSFCATVLQGGSYLPMSPCSAPEKMSKTRVAYPYYGFPKYF
ncbi:protein monoglycylase TTLL8 [Pituophis catenifer annectens]|uniref:protein monoglycylase TTLL8 n=1 Tax=Pituophis catenifer annectens TaxID=94852 RepID=UPI00399522CF